MIETLCCAIICDKCGAARVREYGGLSESQEVAEERLVFDAKHDGWQLIEGFVFCSKCLRLQALKEKKDENSNLH